MNTPKSEIPIIIRADLLDPAHDFDMDFSHNPSPQVLDELRSIMEPYEDVDPITDMHVAHRHVLGRAAVSQDLLTYQKVLDGDKNLDNAWLDLNVDNTTAQTIKNSAEIRYQGTIVGDEQTKKLYLEEVRDTLRQTLTDPQAAIILESYMNSLTGATQKIPEFIRNNYNASGSKMWADWLSADANNDMLLNFLQWHNFSLAETQQTPEIQAKITEQKQAYSAAIKQALNSHHLPWPAAESLVTLEDIEVLVGDVFDTSMNHLGGYHIYNSNYIVLAENNIEQAGMHEFNHAVLGNITYSWLDEALTEHIAMSLKHGKFDEIHVRGEKAGTYLDELLFVDLLAEIVAKSSKKYNSKKDAILHLVYAYVLGEEVLHEFDLELTAAINKKCEFSGLALGVLNLRILDEYKKNIKSGQPDYIAMGNAVDSVRTKLKKSPKELFGPRGSKKNSP